MKYLLLKKKGYTLIEVMIALSVFAIIATITSTVMYHVFNTRARVAAQANQLAQLQWVMTLFQHDITQFVPRSIRSNDAHIFSAFTGTQYYMEFTRGGLVNPNAVAQRSTLKRIAYLCKGKKLIRRSWPSLDMPERNQFEDRILLRHLKHCSFAYVSQYHQIVPEWHVYTIQAKQKVESLPAGVQLLIDPFGWGKMDMLFVLPEGLYG